MLVCHQAFYARTDFAVANPFNLDYRYSADVDWCIRVMRQADQERVPMLNLHTVVAHYLNEGTTTRHHRDSLRERFSVMRSHYQTRQFNAWFRWLIYKNLMMIMGLPYSFDEFRAMDARNIDSASFTRAPELPEDWTDKMPLAGDCIAIEESR
jgi:hypothetical protein